MKYIKLTFWILLFTIECVAQDITFSEHSILPEPVTNNAVCYYENDGQAFLLSFGGIDSTKACGATHLRSFRYDLISGQGWESIDDLPDNQIGKIGIGASQVGDLVYIIGGYTVINSCTEISSQNIHIYDPLQNIYLDNGALLNKPIDDHVQAVYQDRYIYVVTGWSNNTNLADVQIYDTQDDIWLKGTPVPFLPEWRVFGASGTIVGDTIYYSGGATYVCNTSSCFEATNVFRKGVIDPNDPTQIEWIGTEDPNAKGYRMGVITYQENPMWLGGSELTYNFDGIDYNGSGGIPPSRKTALYNIENGSWITTQNKFPGVMDHRGLADARSLNSEAAGIYVVGGMLGNQIVTDKVYKLEINGDISSVQQTTQNDIKVYPSLIEDDVTIKLKGSAKLKIISMQGELILQQDISDGTTISCADYQAGIYFVSIERRGKDVSTFKIIKL